MRIQRVDSGASVGARLWGTESVPAFRHIANVNILS